MCACLILKVLLPSQPQSGVSHSQAAFCRLSWTYEGTVPSGKGVEKKFKFFVMFTTSLDDTLSKGTWGHFLLNFDRDPDLGGGLLESQLGDGIPQS